MGVGWDGGFGREGIIIPGHNYSVVRSTEYQVRITTAHSTPYLAAVIWLGAVKYAEGIMGYGRPLCPEENVAIDD